MIEVVMEPAAFGSLHGALDDQLGHGGQVAQFEEVGRDDVVPVIFLNLGLNVPDPASGALEASVGADNAT